MGKRNDRRKRRRGEGRNLAFMEQAPGRCRRGLNGRMGWVLRSVDLAEDFRHGGGIAFRFDAAQCMCVAASINAGCEGRRQGLRR
jgi:hypothetical protein